MEPPVETTSSTMTTFLLDISGPSIFFFVPCSLSADLTRNPLKEFLSLDAFSNIAPTIGSAPIEGPPTIFKFCSIICL